MTPYQSISGFHRDWMQTVPIKVTRDPVEFALSYTMHALSVLREAGYLGLPADEALILVTKAPR